MNKFFFALALVGTFAITIISHLLTYQISRDTDAILNRAQVAADREDMLEYLQSLSKNLQNLGMDRGHTVLIFKKPDNDMELYYKTLNRLMERLTSISDIPKNDTAYQVALDDIRGTIRELENPANGIAWVKYDWWFILIVIFLWISWFISYVAETTNSKRNLYYR